MLTNTSTILSVALFLLAGCTARHPAPDAGTFTDGVYRNDFFGLTVEVPDDLSVKMREDVEELRSSLETLTGEKIRGEGISGTGEVLLLARLRRGSDADSVWRYSLSVISEQLDRLAGIETSEQYADALTAMRGGDISPATEHISIDGREFIRLSETLHGTVTSDIYTRVERGYALMVTLTYDSIIQSATIDSLLESIRFESTPRNQ